MTSTTKTFNIAVVGIGAMGGGMARALLESPVSNCVTAYDQATPLVEAFHQDAQAAKKQQQQQQQQQAMSAAPPACLADAVTHKTQFVVVVLQNEAQCEAVCFGTESNDNDHDNLLHLMPPNSCLIVCSTVAAAWMKGAAERFAKQDKRIHFVDCPVSGGPLRARQGDLTLLASGHPTSVAHAKPILQALARDVHIISGGPGQGSTAKMVHQLLAGVHIVTAAEALALAAKAGLDVSQMYEIVMGAAGASWMFGDRGQRMIAPSNDGTAQEVKSQMQIFVKDLDIVYSEAKRLQSPIPLASVALQQFISAQSLGLSKADDSQVVKVYEHVTGVSVSKKSTAQQRILKDGDAVGDVWTLEDGRKETILEVADEPRHHLLLLNAYVRALRVSFPPNDTTLAHRHDQDSLYFFLVEGGLQAVNHIKGSAPVCDCMEFGEIRFGTHKSDQPLIHKITNQSNQQLLAIDAEVLRSPPVTAAIPLVADKHELVKTRDSVRVYQLTLEPGESVTVAYPFFCLTVAVHDGSLEKGIERGPKWVESVQRGHVAWKEPSSEVTRKNVGKATYVEYIAEWR